MYLHGEFEVVVDGIQQRWYQQQPVMVGVSDEGAQG